jgi:subtilase family serine protease
LRLDQSARKPYKQHIPPKIQTEYFMRPWKYFLPLLATSLCFAAQPDRITSPINSNQIVTLQGNVHGLAQSQFDIGRTDGSKLMYGVSLVFHPSVAQQKDLHTLSAQQQDRSSPNYHKWLTPSQFADRFGMSRGDIARVRTWLESEGFVVTSIANSRNQISFQGTVAQVESAFAIEIHDYVVDGETHYANSTEPSVPAALAGSVLAVGHLHNFTLKPRAIVRRLVAPEADPHFTSYVSGSHFVAPGDFATIYDVAALYNSGTDGTGEKIVLTGQSSINLSDISNFRSAAGLAAKVPTLLLEPGTGTSTRCSGDEGESDLDVEWSGAVAKNASITLVYAGLATGDTCSSRQFGAFDALHYAIDQNLASVISNSYGNCESAVGLSFAQTMQGWVQQANLQGQTVISASGDDGAADCDYQVASATHGLAVDIPAAIPEVTGMGGTEFTGDAEGTVTNGNAGATSYWSGTTGGTDTISSALSYIPEDGWNDTTFNLTQPGGTIGASGGGASIYFSKPTWQTGVGVPNDGKRDVPDLALNASPDHDGYLFCSEDGPNNGLVTTCSVGFRDGTGGSLAVVGGTSAAAPTFAGIVALLNQYLGSSGLGLINPTLYSLSASNPTAFHDVTTGNNIVPCTQGTTGCPTSAPFQYGFNAGIGYDQVTGLGSVDANALAVAWRNSEAPDFQLSAGTLSLSPVPAGQQTSTTLTIAPVSGSSPMTVNFAPANCTGLPSGATCSFNPTSVYFDGTSAPPVTLTIFTLANSPLGTQTITITPTNSPNTSTTVSLAITKTNQAFTITPSAATYSVAPGATASVPITVAGTNGFIIASSNTTALPITYTCLQSSLPSDTACAFSPGSGNSVSATAVSLSISTIAPTSQLRSPLSRGNHMFYALLLPGLFGLVLAAGSRSRGIRLLGLIVVLSFSTLWLGACGGGSSRQSNPGTPAGSYTLVVNATTGGSMPLTATMNVHLTVQ